MRTISPKWKNYGSYSTREISKPGLVFFGTRGEQPGQTFEPGVGMDKVLDMRFNTGLRSRGKAGDAKLRALLGKQDDGPQEHNDMGNIIPRILRCINELNQQMGAHRSGGLTTTPSRTFLAISSVNSPGMN